MKECIVILGMHRSGTSVLSGLISLQGFHIGISEMPIREDNPKGFFENHAIYRFNQLILEDHDTSWDNFTFTFDQIKPNKLKAYQEKATEIIKKEFGLTKRIFIKDPRMCLLFPLWESVLKNLGFKIKVIFAFRSPMEVALSLKARNDFVLEKSILMWSHYCFQAEKNSRSYRPMVVHYARDFHDLDAFFKKVAEYLKVELTEDMIQAAHDLYSPKLKHHQIELDNLSEEVPTYLREFIALLKEGKTNQVKKLDRIIEDFYYSQDLYLYDDASLRKKIDILEGDNKSLQGLQSETVVLLENNKTTAKKDNEELKKQVKKQLEEVESKAKKQLEEAESKAKKQLEEAESKAKKQLEEAESKAKKQLEDFEYRTKIKFVELETSSLKHIEESRSESKKKLRKIKHKAQKQLKESECKYDDTLRRKIKLEEDLGKSENLSKQLKEKFRKTEQRLKGEIRQKNLTIKSSYNHLGIGNQLFLSLQTDEVWKKKFSRLLKDSRYFKIKRALLPLASRKNKAFMDEKILIIESGLFSPFYYLTRYPKAWESQVDPLNFFNKHGWKEEQNPGPDFDTGYYLRENKDVAKSGVNPLVHYIRKGKSEGRLPKPPKLDKPKLVSAKGGNPIPQKQNLLSSALALTYRGPTKGNIVKVEDDNVSGWLVSKVKHSIPVIKVNGFPAKNIGFNLSSTDVPSDIKHDVGFSSKARKSFNKQAKIELLMLSEEGVTSVDKKTIETSLLVRNKFVDLENALSISKNKNAVAITVWEGSHNPIGRAKVLYDIAALKRPVVIFAYSFGDFGNDLWQPLKNAGLNIVLIPYAERYSYQAYIQNQNIKFNTVWICKHRLHSFELASFIAKPNTACILDMDDNEDVFVSSKASEFKPYGIFSKNKANYYLNRIKTRSVASISIQETYGGHIMRHARKAYITDNPPIKDYYKTKTAVFIGTIRPHKNVTELVDAITTFNRTSTEKIQLAIGGDFNPASLKKTLAGPDTIILDTIANNDLFDTLANYDIVITGFPNTSKENADINKLQITSKIGDGLAVGLPVLTPLSPSVEDLQDVSGLFVFTKDNFSEQLKEAMEFTKKVELPEQFTLDYSYETFKTLENKAKNESKAKDIFELEPLYQYANKSASHKKNIVLVWKQYDSGVYGRRIDHIARYYKQKYPDCNVTIIEAISEADLQNLERSKTLFDNSSIILNDVLSQKIYHYSRDGVEYRLITHKDQIGWNSFDKKFNYFLSSEGVYPHNSVIILFPILNIYDELLNIINEYKVIVDLVDNQVKWMKKPEVRLKGLKQYYDLITIADEVVANSPTNINYFKELNFFEGRSEPKFIPNWYTMPDSFSFRRDINQDEINLIYSGNLNDRIDWDLFKDICTALEPYNGYLHIVGTTVRSSEEMQDLLKQPNCIYHGVINETQLLRLLQHINFAVVPHIEDNISKFMDPIKLKMYKKLGITSLCSQLPSLPQDDPMLIIADSRTQFLNKLEEMLKDAATHTTDSFNGSLEDKIGDEYLKVIDGLFTLS